MDEKTDEKETPGQPNESMPLGENRGGGEEPLFYYSRNRRLSKAPAGVRALYEENEGPKFNLIRPLFSTRPNAILFGTMVALVLITLVINISGLGQGARDYYGNRVSVHAVRYEGVVVVSLKKTRQDGGAAYTGPLDIAVSPLEGADSGAEAAVYPYRLNFSSRSPEEFSFSIPFEGSQFLVRISHEGAGEGGSLAFKIKTR
ncbi:MAG: hypothetical protein LBD96_01515 [Treponema sp.]|jgi:hypothetical protein|nr:hypothetical protein [Treponema sp.]